MDSLELYRSSLRALVIAKARQRLANWHAATEVSSEVKGNIENLHAEDKGTLASNSNQVQLEVGLEESIGQSEVDLNIESNVSRTFALEGEESFLWFTHCPPVGLHRTFQQEVNDKSRTVQRYQKLSIKKIKIKRKRAW